MELRFEEFWKLYPRKVSKRMAEKAWNKMNPIDQDEALEAIPKHVEYWSLAETEKEFIPHASTWLNQARYEDEIELPEKRQQKAATVAWWGSDSLILAKGKELGLEPRPGETMFTFKDRVAEAIRRTA